KRMAGASMALFAASLLLVSCGLRDLTPDSEESPECRELRLERLAYEEIFAARDKAYADYVSQPFASPDDEYAKSLHWSIWEVYDIILEIMEDEQYANCK